MNRLALVTAAAVIALLAAGCMSGGTSDRSARKAALSSETTGEVVGSMDIQGVASGIDIYSFSWSATHNSQGGQMNHVVITKKINPASYNLVRAAVILQSFPSVTIQLLPVGGRPYATYELTSVVIEEVDQSAGDRGDEQVALAGTCTSFMPAGGTRFGWNNGTGHSC